MGGSAIELQVIVIDPENGDVILEDLFSQRCPLPVGPCAYTNVVSNGRGAFAVLCSEKGRADGLRCFLYRVEWEDGWIEDTTRTSASCFDLRLVM